MPIDERYYQEFGNLLKMYRERFPAEDGGRLSQRKLSELLDKFRSDSAIEKYERGIGRPSPSFVVIVGEILHLSDMELRALLNAVIDGDRLKTLREWEELVLARRAAKEKRDGRG